MPCSPRLPTTTMSRLLCRPPAGRRPACARPTPRRRRRAGHRSRTGLPSVAAIHAAAMSSRAARSRAALSAFLDCVEPSMPDGERRGEPLRRSRRARDQDRAGCLVEKGRGGAAEHDPCLPGRGRASESDERRCCAGDLVQERPGRVALDEARLDAAWPAPSPAPTRRVRRSGSRRALGRRRSRRGPRSKRPRPRGDAAFRPARGCAAPAAAPRCSAASRRCRQGSARRSPGSAPCPHRHDSVPRRGIRTIADPFRGKPAACDYQVLLRAALDHSPNAGARINRDDCGRGVRSPG